jgi:selenide,water dikinase
MRTRKNGWHVPVASDAIFQAEKMRCGGCGAKVGADMLARVLGRLKVSVPAELVSGIGEDAAVLRPVVNELQVQTIDGFRAMIDDPYILGRIAAEHSINDVYAMGGVPRTALAWAVVPYADEKIMEDDLFQLMAGAIHVFDAAGTSLVGGHSGEGPEMSVGFAITGTVDERDIWQKHKLQIGDCLVLTKPVGTGVLLAAHLQAKCRAVWLVAALEHMQYSNKDAVSVFREFGVRACTDVTGFGVLGHLGEMARAAKLCIRLWPRAVPALAGARRSIRKGIVSSLQAVNERGLADIDLGGFEPEDVDIRLLFDPQTSGGLVAAVRPENLEGCIAGLRAAGYSTANVIGQVREARDDGRWAELAELAKEVPAHEVL